MTPFSRTHILEILYSRTDQFYFFGHNFGSICLSFWTPFLAQNAIFDTLNKKRTFPVGWSFKITLFPGFFLERAW